MADPNSAVEALGNFPIVQIAIVAVIAFGAVFGWRYGERQPTNNNGNNGNGGGVNVYFDGPLVKALGTLEGILRMMKEVRTDLEKADTRREKQLDEELEILREIRDNRTRRKRR